MATAPSAPPLEVSKPLPGEASREQAPLPPTFEPSKPFPQGGPPSYPPPRPPVVGYPQPVQPDGLFGQRSSRNRGGYHSGTVQDTEAGVRGHRHDRLPCCGLGICWVLFIIGFILGAIPWYVGAILLCFYREKREKPGLIACTVAAVIGTIIIIIAAVLPAEVHVH